MIAWIPLILAAGQGILSAKQQKEAADRYNREQDQFEKLNASFANKDLLASYVAIAARRTQERSVLFNSLEEVTLDATRRIGAVSVSAGESGVHGKSSAALVNDFKISQLKSEAAIMDTEKYMQEQYDRDVKAARAQRDSRVLMAQRPDVPGPNFAQIFLDATTSYLQMSSLMKQANTYQGQEITNQNVPQLPGGAPPSSGGFLDLPALPTY